MGTAPRKGFNSARKVGSNPANGGLTGYKLATGYATALAVGDPVQLTTDGTVIQAANNAGNLGIIAGINYTDSTGNVKIDKYWPASTAATDLEVLVADDPLATYHVLADGPIPEAICFPGVMYAMNLTAPDANTGRSQMTVNSIPTVVGDLDISAMTDLPTDIAALTANDAFTIQTTNPANSAATIVMTAGLSPAAFLVLLNAVAGISATIDGTTGFLTIAASDGYLITTVETVGNVITDFFAVASHTAAGGKTVAIASAMVKVVSVPDRANKQLEVALTLPGILADS